MATGDNSGTVISGDRNRIAQHTVVLPKGGLSAAVEDGSVARVNNLPAPDSRVFNGRADALDQLGRLPSAGTGIGPNLVVGRAVADAARRVSLPAAAAA
ncbi:hypothetical protein AN216_26135 [Streptomyces oceani]|uniref:Uncharacterized protein n=1 Tax=Streptomyces oceani TaxID=1075402 RepID=A0A1E7JJ45_9ACTN|nr:hypothetical protein AN216_26135 [Streptomyces oceani]